MEDELYNAQTVLVMMTAMVATAMMIATTTTACTTVMVAMAVERDEGEGFGEVFTF